MSETVYRANILYFTSIFFVNKEKKCQKILCSKLLLSSHSALNISAWLAIGIVKPVIRREEIINLDISRQVEVAEIVGPHSALKHF